MVRPDLAAEVGPQMSAARSVPFPTGRGGMALQCPQNVCPRNENFPYGNILWLLFGFRAVVEVSAAVLLPTLFRLIGADRLTPAVGNGVNPVGRHAGIHQEVFGRGGAAVSQAEVVFLAATLVTMAFESEFNAGVFFQKTRVAGQQLFRVSPDVRFVKVEVRIFNGIVQVK